jgi:predicted DNA-binding transcriptional regulator AlpA
MSTSQDLFDQRYISTAEIMKTLSVSRAAVWYARERGVLPDAIFLNQTTCLWERDKLLPYLEKWIADRKASSKGAEA